jgi:hypothetical protein
MLAQGGGNRDGADKAPAEAAFGLADVIASTDEEPTDPVHNILMEQSVRR